MLQTKYDEAASSCPNLEQNTQISETRNPAAHVNAQTIMSWWSFPSEINGNWFQPNALWVQTVLHNNNFLVCLLWINYFFYIDDLLLCHLCKQKIQLLKFIETDLLKMLLTALFLLCLRPVSVSVNCFCPCKTTSEIPTVHTVNTKRHCCVAVSADGV